jgi:hypothetical protein
MEIIITLSVGIIVLAVMSYYLMKLAAARDLPAHNAEGWRGQNNVH